MPHVHYNTLLRSLRELRWPLSVSAKWTASKTKGLVTNYGEGGGGLQNGRGVGAREVLPLRRGGGGAQKVLAMLKGGHKKFWGSFYAVA